MVTFDKTGTLTYGTPAVTAVRSVSERNEREILRLAAVAEKRSEHPLGKAVVRGWEGDVPDPEAFAMLPGEGVSAVIGGEAVLAGTKRLLERNGVPFPYAEAEPYVRQGSTVVYLSAGARAAGFLVLSDAVRPEGKDTVAQVRALGVTPVLLTGDHREAAGTIAEMTGIREVRAECMPEDKLTAIDAFREKGDRVCMVGDGINDAPALKRADVGIAMGGVGSDIAVEAADIVLVGDEIGRLPHLLALSRRMMTVIRFNLAFSLGLNFLAIVLAITGLLSPVVGALVHNLGSVLVIVNSAFLLKWRRNPRKTGS